MTTPPTPPPAAQPPIAPVPAHSAALLCPGEAITLAHLRQLIHAALPDKSRHKAQGWFGQTDFLLTRRHQDEDGDTYHDGVFLTEWKAWDFWFSDVPQPEPASLLAAAAAGLRRLATGAFGGGARPATGFTRLYRAYGDDGTHGPWRPMDDPDAEVPPAASLACDRAWRGLIDYWRRADAERRAGRPLRQHLLATLTPARIEALTLLPVFTEQYNDWWDAERSGWWQGDVWVGARQPCTRLGRRWSRALKLSWQHGTPAPGDDADDAHACYQIEVERGHGSHGAHGAGNTPPNAVQITYAQRQSDERVPLPVHAVDHMAHLLDLFTAVEQQLHQAQAEQHERDADTRRIAQPVHLLGAPPFADHAADASIFPPELLAASEAWQADGRAYAAQWRERLQGESAGAAQPAPAQGQTQEPQAPQHPEPLDDPRRHRAATVLQLARVVSRHADAGLAARLHRRFAFAPHVYARRAAESGQPVGPVLWLDDGSVAARLSPAGCEHSDGKPCSGTHRSAAHWLHVQADGVRWARVTEAALAAHGRRWADAMATAAGRDGKPSASTLGLRVTGDAQGDLHGTDEDGHVLWHHHVGGAVTGIDLSPDGRTLVAGTSGGYLVLLRKGSGPDPYAIASSRFIEAWRLIFWTDEPDVIRW